MDAAYYRNNSMVLSPVCIIPKIIVRWQIWNGWHKKSVPRKSCELMPIFATDQFISWLKAPELEHNPSAQHCRINYKSDPKDGEHLAHLRMIVDTQHKMWIWSGKGISQFFKVTDCNIVIIIWRFEAKSHLTVLKTPPNGFEAPCKNFKASFGLKPFAG